MPLSDLRPCSSCFITLAPDGREPRRIRTSTYKSSARGSTVTWFLVQRISSEKGRRLVTTSRGDGPYSAHDNSGVHADNRWTTLEAHDA